MIEKGCENYSEDIQIGFHILGHSCDNCYSLNRGFLEYFVRLNQRLQKW